MANSPNPQSYEQLLSDMLSAYAAKMGINDFNVGSAVSSFFEVVALTTARASGDHFQILRDKSVDRATGDALKALATENNVPLITAKVATGLVTVTDTSFSKIFTKVYAGTSAPNIGSTQIKVSDASSFPSTGSIYIGRSTPNVEGPLPYTSITQVGGYYVVNLSVPTTKFHNVGETVILAQGGNRSIGANSVVIAPASGASPDIQFTVTSPAVILDGEVSVDNVQVSALTPGTDGNVPRGAIKRFATPPFSGATVTNALSFTTGKDSETDDELRVRIKRALASKGLGTPTAIQSAVNGAQPSDENATVASSSIINNSSGAILYVDDNTGYEAKSAGVGLEAIIDSALGGEQFFQLATGGRQAPVAKAFLQSTLAAPFDIVGGDTLAITVGEQTYQHIFADTDFRSPGGVTAYEIAASVNANTEIGFEATTAESGQYIIFRAIAEGNDSLLVAAPTTSGRDAAVQLGLPSNQIQTLRLYKNKIPLSKDGKSASLFTQGQQLWSSTITSGETLVLSVDSTSFITYTITDADFLATALYTSVANTNSLESWAQVLNNKLTGVTVSVVGQQLKVTSNLDASNRAKLVIDASSTLVTKGMFSSSIGLTAQGKASDYTLSRNTAQFELASALVAGDNLAAGTSETEARIESSQIPGGSITLTADANLWLLVDSAGTIVPHGVAGNTVLSVSKPSTNVIRFTSAVTTAFADVNVGDYVIIWSQELAASDRFEGRVHAVTNSSFDIMVTPTEYAAAATTAGIVFSEGLVFLRSDYVPQKFKITSGTKTLDQIATELQSQTSELIFSVLQEQYLVVRTRTKDTTGSILVVTADTTGKLLSFTANQSDVSKDSLIAFYDSQSSEAEMPLFLHALFASGTAADPISSYITSVQSSVSLSGRDPNELIAFLQPFGSIADAQSGKEHVQESAISGAAISVAQNPALRRVRSVDRFFLASPLDFGAQDTAVVVLDNDTSSKSFEVPFYRRGITNTSFANNSSAFNAYDVDSGASANFSSAFGADFDFSNFKVLMQAKKVLDPSGAKNAILYRATRWGRSGEKINVGYAYPSAANAGISFTSIVDGTVDVLVSLKSGSAITTSIDGSTEWNVTITPNTPVAGIDQVTYTWSGTGTSPGLTLSGGEYVNIGDTTELNSNNTGVFRVSTQAGFTPTSTSFTVQRPTGAAVAEVSRATLVPSAIQFYNKSDTAAAEVAAYVAANLTDYFSATLVNDGGSDGSGTISLSTYEDSGFQYASQYLQDGINWIASCNLGGSPQFTFKKTLSLPSDTGYTFNNGEEIRLIPTTMDQVRRLLSVLAVTGLTTVGTIGVVDRGSRIELASDVLGSSGAIQVIGGLANRYQVPVLDSAVRIDNQLSKISVDKISAQGVSSDQWFRLAATVQQTKEALLSSNSSVNVLGNNLGPGLTTIQLLNRSLNQRYFGKPRHHTRVLGRTFRIEKQGSLVCLTWNGTGASPVFSKSSVNFNSSGGGTLNISLVTGTSEADISILTGNGNFNELSIGDVVTISGLPTSANNGSFLVTGVSDDGKTLRVLNGNAANEYSHGSFAFNANPNGGDSFTLGVSTLVAGTDFVIGATPTDTAANFAAVAGTLSGMTAKASGTVVTITATSAAASIPLAYSGVASIAVSQLVGDSYTGSTFSASTEVSEGDTVTLAAPFAVLNQGRYRVIRRYGDSIWLENPNVVEEEVTLPANTISLGVDATTSLKVNATNYTQYVNWNGVGTEPHLENAQMGDVVTFGTDFSSANQGQFMILRSGIKLQEITQLVMPTGTQLSSAGPGQYFLINSAGDLNQYYVWFNVNGGNTDPAVGGRTGLQVAVLNGDSSTQVASKVAAIVNAATGLTASSSGGVVTVTTTGYQETTHASNFNVPAPFSVTISQAGRRTFFECVNPSAANQSAVFVNNVMTCNRPQLSFTEYESTIPGDKFVVVGDILTSSNAGSFTVVQVIDRDTAVIAGSLASVSNVSLNGRETSITIQEGVPYTGYKRVLLTSVEPGAPTRAYVVFDTNAQYEKINEASGIELTSLNKMNFATVIRKGLDSYRYHTGMIAEANRIIYGDPRDPESYPGVGAAGAEIFVREPLSRRIQVSIDVRIATGVPFAQIAEQVRTSVSSLINSNDVGQSIAISSIVAAVNAIPGVRAMAISSPQYDATHDIIKLATSEKARIIDPTTDISVSQIGT